MNEPRDPSKWSRRRDTPLRIRVSRVLLKVRDSLRGSRYRDVWMFLITCIVGLALQSAISASSQASDTSIQARSAALRADAAARRAAGLAIEIQDQRHDSVLNNCLAQNLRHDSTIAALKATEKQQAKKAPGQLLQLFTLIGVHVSPASARLLGTFEQAQAAAGVASTTLLIDALAPHQECAHVVAVAFGATGLTGPTGLIGVTGSTGQTGVHP